MDKLREKIVKIISGSTMCVLGISAHNALSELTESLADYITKLLEAKDKELDRRAEEWRNAEVRIKELEGGRTFYRSRVLELDDHKNEFPEPYLTMICNIIANGRIKP